MAGDLGHPFSFLVQGLSDDGEDNSPNGEEFGAGPQRLELEA